MSIPSLRPCMRASAALLECRQNINLKLESIKYTPHNDTSKSKAKASREAWVQSMDASDTARYEKMAPKRTKRSSPTTTTTPTTSVTDEKLMRLITQGVADVLAEREATRSENSKDNHDSGMGGRR
ncbi:hypothetical protein Tco_1508896 [Tanacetum coccineum]